MAARRNDPNTAEVAIRLSVVLNRVRARLREEAGATKTGLTGSQLSVLREVIEGDGTKTAAVLAADEHVSQQAISQTLATLKGEQLVETTPDPRDGRKTLISATTEGRELFALLLEARDAWLVRAIDSTMSVAEQTVLVNAIDLLERLADADLRAPVGIR